MATKAKAQADLPIYLRAKFVGSTHISMPILRILDSVFWLGDTLMGGVAGGVVLEELRLKQRTG